MNKGTIIRAAVLAMALVNHFLTMVGKNPLPFDDVMIEQFVAFVFDAAAAWVGWYKNNDTSKEGAEGTGITRLLKKQKKDQKKGIVTGENFFDEVEDKDANEDEEEDGESDGGGINA